MIERLDIAEWERAHDAGGAYRLTIDSVPQLLREIGRAQASETHLIGANHDLQIQITALKAAIFELSSGKRPTSRQAEAQTPASIIRRHGLENLTGLSNQELKSLTGFNTVVEKRRYYRLCLAIANHPNQKNQEEQ